MLGSATTVTTIGSLVTEQKLVLVAVTVYVPEVVIVFVDPFPIPLFQKYPLPPLAVKTTLPPVQKVVVDAAVITGVGKALTVTTVAALIDAQPLASVDVTVYDAAAEAVYVSPVPTVDDPLLQEYDVPPLAVKTTLSPEQKDVGAPLAEIVGVDGKGLTVIVPIVVIVPQPPVNVTV
jgi:hypothetical protein